MTGAFGMVRLMTMQAEIGEIEVLKKAGYKAEAGRVTLRCCFINTDNVTRTVIHDKNVTTLSIVMELGAP